MTFGIMPAIRIFISSPGDVKDERDKAKLVIADLQRRYDGQATLIPVLWEDLAIPATASFQEGIDHILEKGHRIDIAVFILWSRLGTPLGSAIMKADGSPYLSGTEREFDLMLQAFRQSGGQSPVILAYTRRDDEGFSQKLDLGTHGEDALEEMIKQRKLVKNFIKENFTAAEGHNVRAYHSYREPVGFAQRLLTHLQSTIDDLLKIETQAITWGEAPYRSLEVFEIQHAPIFCGRAEETCVLLERLRDQRRGGSGFVCIVAASGSGKSSLARAGVAATLERRAFENGVAEWRAAIFLPGLAGAGLCAGLAATLADVLPELAAGNGGLARFTKNLEDGNHEAANILLESAISATRVKGAGLPAILLVLDQMEELWTIGGITPEQREAFLSCVEQLARGGHVTVLATLRGDFYPQAQLSPAFLRMKEGSGHYDLTPPDTASLREIITEPARRSGFRFERDENTGRTLDQRILEDATRDPSALPLLQFALAELYGLRNESRRLLTFAAYDAMEGVEGALGNRATRLLEELPAHARAALDEILPLLVSVDTAASQSAVRRRALLSELTSTPAREGLVRQLTAARFLTTDSSGGMPVASLAHEALLRCWPKVTEWININRDFLRMRARVEQYQSMWEESGRDTSRLLPPGLPLEEGKSVVSSAVSGLVPETRDYIAASITLQEKNDFIAARKRRANIAISIAAVVAVIMGAIAWRSKNIANEQRAEAVRQGERAMAQARETEVQKQKAERQGSETEKQRVLVSKERDNQQKLLHNASQGDHEAAIRSFRSGNRSEGLAYLRKSLELVPQNEGTLISGICFSTGPSAPMWLTRKVIPGSGARSVLAFSPDGYWLVGSKPYNGVRIFDLKSNRELNSLGYEIDVSSIHFSPDGSILLLGTYDHMTSRQLAFAVPSKKRYFNQEMPKGSRIVGFGPDSSWFARENEDGSFHIHDSHTGKEIRNMPASEKESWSVTSADTSLHASAPKQGGDITVTHLDTGEKVLLTKHDGNRLIPIGFTPANDRLICRTQEGFLRSIDVHRGMTLVQSQVKIETWATEIDPGGKWIANTTREGKLQMLDTASLKVAWEVELEMNDSNWELAFSADCRWLAVSANTAVHLFNSATGERSGDVIKNTRKANIAFSPDGHRLAIASDVIRILEPTGQRQPRVLGFDRYIESISFGPGERWIATVFHDATASITDTKTGKTIREFSKPEGISSMDTSPDGRIIALGHGNKLSLIDLEDKAPTREFSFKEKVLQISFSATGQFFAVAFDDIDKVVFNTLTGKSIFRQEAANHNLDADSVGVSADGRWVSTGRGGIIDTDTGEEMFHKNPKATVDLVAFSPDNKLVALGGSQTVYLHELLAPGYSTLSSILFSNRRKYQEIVTDGKIQSLDFSPDGRLLLLGMGDKSARVVEVKSGKELCNLPFDAAITDARFSRDGTHLGVSMNNKTITLTDIRWFAASNAALPLWKDYLSFQSGRLFEEDGRIRDLTDQEWTQIGNRLDRQARAPDGPAKGGYETIRWALAPVASRPVSPWGDEPLWQKVGSELMNADAAEHPDIIASMADAAPWHPLEPISLARCEDDAGARRYLAQLTLRRLKKPDLALYDTATLDTYAAKAAEWMTGMVLPSEAIETADLALSREPEMTEALRAKARALGQLARYDDALAIYQKIRTRPDAILTDFTFGGGFAGLAGMTDVLEASFNGAVERFPAEAKEIEFTEAWARINANQADRALDIFKREREGLSGETKPGKKLLAGMMLAHWIAGRKEDAIAAGKEMMENNLVMHRHPILNTTRLSPRWLAFETPKLIRELPWLGPREVQLKEAIDATIRENPKFGNQPDIPYDAGTEMQRNEAGE